MSAKARKFRRFFGSPVDSFADQNLAAARLILADVSPHDDSIAIQWARMVIAKHDGGTSDGTEHVQVVPKPADCQR